MYAFFKFTHVLGVVLLVGNVTVTAVWKVIADRTRDVVIVRFAQNVVVWTDWTLTCGGIALIMIGGYGMVGIARMSLLTSWLLVGQLLFVLSGMIWLAVLVPLQAKQAHIARTETKDLSALYWKLGRRWLWWGVAATFPLIGAVYVMVAKS